MPEQKIVELPLSKGFHAIIDAEDVELVREYKWHLLTAPRSKSHYAIGWSAGEKRILLHRLIMGIVDPIVQVDHIDRDGLNCRRSNMRLCSGSQNCSNRPAKGANRYRGVSKRPDCERFQVQIKIDQKMKYLGLYSTPEIAAEVYNKAALEAFGEFATLNFIEASHA